MNLLLIPLIGLWRMWLGRGVDGWPKFLLRSDGRAFPGATYIQYAIIIGLMFVFIGPWNIALTDAVGILLLARLCGHTPMLYAPGEMPETASLKGTEKSLYDLASESANPEGRWWIFAMMRYWIPAMVWAIALILQNVGHGFYVLVAALAMIAVYRVTAALKIEIKYAELVGWMAYGVALSI